MNAINTACRHYFQKPPDLSNLYSATKTELALVWWRFVHRLYTTRYITPSCGHLLVAIVTIIRPFDHVLYASNSVTTTTWVPS